MTYVVSEVSKMLNVNDETIRRWIREGKLQGKRSKGRGGNAIYLEDVVAFANIPPRAYLSPLEKWLSDHKIAYTIIEDASTEKKAGIEAVVAGTGAALGAALVTPNLLAAPIAIAAGMAYGATKTKRKLYRNYTIQLVHVADKYDDEIHHDAVTDESNLPEVMAMPYDEGKSEQCSINISAEAPVCGHKEITNTSEILESIVRAKQMFDAGIITEDEFLEIKARMIAKI